jgi:hypothetical protein
MPLDTSIIRSGRAPQIMAPGEIAMRGMSLRALARQGELEKKKLANYEEDRAGELRRQSLLEQKYEQDLRRSIKEMDDAEVADVARKSQGMDALMATSNDPTSWRSNIDAAAQQGLINPAEHQMMVATPFDPNTLEAMQRRTKGLAGIAAEEAKERAERIAQQNLTLRTAELIEGREERRAREARLAEPTTTATERSYKDALADWLEEAGKENTAASRNWFRAKVWPALQAKEMSEYQKAMVSQGDRRLGLAEGREERLAATRGMTTSQAISALRLVKSDAEDARESRYDPLTREAQEQAAAARGWDFDELNRMAGGGAAGVEEEGPITATNPATGEKVVWDGEQWRPQ